MLNRKITLLYSLPIVLMSVLVGMVIASRLDLSPTTSAQTVAAPPMNSAPLTGPLTASTFRDIAKLASPAVVNIRTESRQRTQDLSDFFGGGGGDDLFERFFGTPNPRGRGQGGQGGRAAARAGRRRREREQVVQAAGTGFIIDKAGLHPDQQPRRGGRHQDCGVALRRGRGSGIRGARWSAATR